MVKIFKNGSFGISDSFVVYLRIDGSITVDDFYQVIMQSDVYTNDEVKNKKLLEFGFVPDQFNSSNG